ncbi:MAG: hypothetical protein CW716_08775 [Candidatus Bathyarchaeum sp.]|nr:MAG: hypothetical protein CW716_08775 [Candidatus Bathyarchaeum sp.]
MFAQLQNKLIVDSEVFLKIKSKISEAKSLKETYSLLQRLASINGSNVTDSVLDRVMYSAEMLPPLGKEYWWFLFFGRDGEKPIQMMLLLFRKYGQNMLFNDKKFVLKKLTENSFQAVATGWVYDGNEMHNLGDTNAVTTVYPERKRVESDIQGQKMVLSGGFPNYKLKLGDIIDLEIRKGEYVEDKYAHGVFIPPVGMGWVDGFLDAEGTVLGKGFNGTAHLQKVFGITTFGSFHWGRIFFNNGSSTSFFCLKTEKNSKRYFHRSLSFHDYKRKKVIKFKNPKLKISKKEGKTLVWIVEGHDDDKKIRIALEVYVTNQFTMQGGGSQTYIEYAVIPREFSLKTANQVITLSDLGKGVGTFEDAYGSLI